MTPDLVIFRIPDPEEEVVLVQLELEDGILSSQGRKFLPAGPDDSYSETEFYHVILAQKIEGGSINSMRFMVGDGETLPPFYTADFVTMQAVVEHLAEMYEEGEFKPASDSERITLN